MKMSKSIKDYKDAMDSIGISDSFYRRTETLLTELPEIRVDKRPVLSSRRITAAVSAAAVILMAVFGVKFVIDRHEENIEITTEITSITEMPEPEESFTPMPLVDEFEEEEEFEEEAVEDEEPVEEAPDNETGEGLDGGAAAYPDPKPKENEKTDGTSKTDKNPKTDKDGKNNTSVTAENTDDNVIESTDDDTPDGGGIIISTENEEEAPAGSDIAEATGGNGETPAGGTAETRLFGDLVYTDISVEITPYFNMGTIRSGEAPVKMSGSDCAEIIGFIAYLTKNSSLINNITFSSRFYAKITDNATGSTLYSVYVTEQNTLVVTKHGADGQMRTTYAITPDDFEALQHILFLQFGSEEDYELFKNLISGK